MESVLRYLLRWPSVESFLLANVWGWSTSETLHFVGLSLLVGIIGMYDLRVLGMAKGLPLVALKRLLPWAVFGFALCAISGFAFVGGLGANLFGTHPYDVLLIDVWLQLKLLFIVLAGVNLLAFYLTGTGRVVDRLGPEDDAPPLAKVFAGASLFLWTSVVVLGRLIPKGL